MVGDWKLAEDFQWSLSLFFGSEVNSTTTVPYKKSSLMTSGITWSCAHLTHSSLTTTAIWNMRWKTDSCKGITDCCPHSLSALWCLGRPNQAEGQNTFFFFLTLISHKQINKTESYHCIAFNSGAYLVNFAFFDSRKYGRICSLTKQKYIT